MKKDLSIRRLIKKSVCTGRGLSNSRNMALENAEDDICILCDDDVVYCDRYAELVEEALEKVPDADMMVFNIETISPVQAVRRRSRRRHRLKYPSTCRKNRSQNSPMPTSRSLPYWSATRSDRSRRTVLPQTAGTEPSPTR